MIKRVFYTIKWNIRGGKRSMELVREILLYLGEFDDKYFNGIMEINGYGKSEIDYRLQQMLDENLLIGHLLYAYDEVYFHGVALSRYGYQVLDVARNDNVWLLFKNKVGNEIQTIPISVAIDVLKQLSKTYFKSKFGL